MKSKRMRIFAAIAVICLLAAGGAAFTYTNQLPSDTVAGYNNISVSGADISALNNTLSADGQTITGVSMTFSTAIDPAATVEIGVGSHRRYRADDPQQCRLHRRGRRLVRELHQLDAGDHHRERVRRGGLQVVTRD